ncbi:MAG TPA: transcriptional repressor [Actinomycetota bacterium]|nr:transcriptional repressor [Actinomycetota bacterium]
MRPEHPAPHRVGEILDQLAARGMRRTSARQAILEALVGSEDHVTAEDIATEVHRRFPSVDVSTVYRTLDILEQLGIIEHTHLSHGPAIFHLAEDDHQHLVCERCGRVEEVPPGKLEPLLEAIRTEFDFDVDRRHFALVGLCGECRRVSPAPGTGIPLT